MHYEIKRFDLGSVFKITFLISLVIGLLFGIFFGMFIMKMITVFSAAFQNSLPVDVSQFAGAGMVFLVGFIAVALAVQWSVIAVIAAAVYNVLAGSVGGLRVELGEAVPRYIATTVPSGPSALPPNHPTQP